MNERIFREYDIRGVVAEDFPPEVVTALGRAVAAYYLGKGEKRLVLGRDVRPSSDGLASVFREPLLEAGLDVVDLGRCPTPALYFASRHLRADGGVMITGSHNPPGENGFKLIRRQKPVFGPEIREIGRTVGQVAEPGARIRRGTWTGLEVLEPYREALRSGLRPGCDGMRVVVDCGNGTAGPVAVPLYESLGCDVIPLYAEPDGTFPNHHPDPTVASNLRPLIQRVRESGAALGLAFDGDSDRMGAVDERGGIFWGDDLLTLFARGVLEEHSGATIVGDVKCSSRLFRDIEARGGRAVMWKSGHSSIKAKAAEVKALLAGEWSEHFCFSDRFYGFDDGIYAGGRLIEICARASKPASRLLEDLPEVFSVPEERRSCPDDVKFAVIDRLRVHFARRYDTITLDGVRVVMEDAWALVRASNTQPVLVLRFEANSPERLEQVRAMVEQKVSETVTAILSGECRCSTS